MNPFPKFQTWPGNYVDVFMWRQRMVLLCKGNPTAQKGLKEYYKTRPHEFIEHWCDTYDPRNAGTINPTHMPFLLFPRQRDFITFLYQCYLLENDGLVEKCRDVGATWLCTAFSVWAWLFHGGVAIGWGSRKMEYVDKLGDPDSIFEKMRMLIRGLPLFILPKGFSESDNMPFMRIVNPESGATITGESGDNIGRGGRKKIFFKDESAHYERPEKIEAALGDNTRVQIDISSVNGTGNVFHKRRKAGEVWNPFVPMNTKTTSVFIFDWRDHPHKTPEWHEARRILYANRGLSHIFAQEVDRDYAASKVGVIIKRHWLDALVNAHLKPRLAELGLDDGSWSGALDVADEGGDLNAFTARKGVVMKKLSKWGDGDTGFTTRHVVNLCTGLGPMVNQYDCIGVGAGVKAESNRLREANQMRKDLEWVPWSAAGKVLHPEARLVPKDRQSPMNKDYYQNIRSQAWFEFARRAEYTYRILLPADHPSHIPDDVIPDDIISFSTQHGDIDPVLLSELFDELTQVTAAPNVQTGKMSIDKKGEGDSSPNMGDATIMNYWPIPLRRYNILALT